MAITVHIAKTLTWLTAEIKGYLGVELIIIHLNMLQSHCKGNFEHIIQYYIQQVCFMLHWRTGINQMNVLQCYTFNHYHSEQVYTLIQWFLNLLSTRVVCICFNQEDELYEHMLTWPQNLSSECRGLIPSATSVSARYDLYSWLTPCKSSVIYIPRKISWSIYLHINTIS